MSLAHAIFAAGCFWGVQSAFDQVPGVYSTQVGYVGGTLLNPTYELVSRGNSGHAEAIEVTYDPKLTSYSKLLDVFFQIHNPTTRDRQGPDVGKQYRSAIFYTDEAQKQMAVEKIMELNRSGKYKNLIVTEVVPAKTFYPAEEYHQDYLKKSGQKSCSFNGNLQEEEEEEEEEEKSENIPQTSQDWKKKLTPQQYEVLRNKGTERAFTGKYVDFKGNGVYVCGACGNPIFMSDAKFDSESGWPSFDKAIPGHVKFITDTSHGMQRVEVTCAKCGSHLGHVFEDGPSATGDRFCINSVAMGFKNEDNQTKK